MLIDNLKFPHCVLILCIKVCYDSQVRSHPPCPLAHYIQLLTFPFHTSNSKDMIEIFSSYIDSSSFVSSLCLGEKYSERSMRFRLLSNCSRRNKKCIKLHIDVCFVIKLLLPRYLR